MVVKAVNNIAGLDSLVLTLLVFGAYPHMYNMDPPTPTIIQRATAIKKVMEQVRKIQAKNQVIDVLNTRNGPLVDFDYDFSLNFDILIWQEDNIGWTGK